MIRCVLDYPDPQTAFDDAEHGDAVYFPGVRQYTAPAGGWEISKSIEVYGDGPGRTTNGLGTVLKPSTDTPPTGKFNDIFVLAPGGTDLDNVAIRDLCIMGGGGGRDGIHHETGATNKLSQFRVHRVAIAGMAGAGISLVGQADEAANIVGAWITESEVRGCGAEGITLDFGFQILVETSRFIGNGHEAIKAVHTELVATMCFFDGNCVTAGDAQLLLDTCALARIDACRFLNFGATLPALKMLACQGSGQVGSCVFDLGAFQSGSKGIKVGPAPNGPVLILPNRFVGVDTAVDAFDADDPPIACIVMPQYYDGTGASPILLPDPADTAATLAVPSVFTPSANKVSGLLLPALKVGNPRGKTTLFVTWTAPVEPSWTGPVKEYLLVYSTTPITAQNFDQATPFPFIPSPAAPGTQQCASLSNLPSCTTHYFAIKSEDHSGQVSAISNLPSGSTRCSGSVEVDCAEP